MSNKFCISQKEIVFAALFLVFASSVFAIPAEDVKLDGFVKDYAGVLLPEDVSQISSIAQQMYDAKVAQYSVVIVDSFEGMAIEDYSLKVAQGNLGDSNNNGLLLLISVTDREYRFEVGRGLEATLNDARVGRIGRQSLVPAFQAGQYGVGILNASFTIRDLLVVGTEVPADETITFTPDFWLYLVFFLLFIGISSWSSYYQRKHYKKGMKNSDDKYLMAAMIASSLLGGRRGGGGGFSGGFGGFGGGGFSGGGAGGRW